MPPPWPHIRVVVRHFLLLLVSDGSSPLEVDLTFKFSRVLSGPAFFVGEFAGVVERNDRKCPQPLGAGHTPVGQVVLIAASGQIMPLPPGRGAVTSTLSDLETSHGRVRCSTLFR